MDVNILQLDHSIRSKIGSCNNQWKVYWGIHTQYGLSNKKTLLILRGSWRDKNRPGYVLVSTPGRTTNNRPWTSSSWNDVTCQSRADLRPAFGFTGNQSDCIMYTYSVLNPRNESLQAATVGPARDAEAASPFAANTRSREGLSLFSPALILASLFSCFGLASPSFSPYTF